MKSVIEFGAIGKNYSDPIPLDSIAIGSRMAANLVFVFTENASHECARVKEWKVSRKNPRITWSNSTHYVALTIADDVPRGNASCQF